MSQSPNELKQIQSLAHLLDRQFTIPATRFRIGLDGIIGLIPGIGDSLSLVLSSWIIYKAHKLGVPFWVKLRMGWNVFIDWLIGLIPLVGDLFDIGWQANQKNAALVAQHCEKNGAEAAKLS